MDCKHELNKLVGTADGILCTECGKLFKSMDEVFPMNPPEDTAEKPKRKRRVKKDE